MVLGAAALVVREASAAADCMSLALTAIPTCAQSCFLNGAPEIGCGATDFACQCGKQAALMAAIEGCVQTSCKASEFQSVIDGGAKVCKCTGVDAMPAGGSMSGSYAATGSVMPSATASASASATTTAAGYPTVKPSATKPTSEPTTIVSSGANSHAAAGLLAGVAAAVALL